MRNEVVAAVAGAPKAVAAAGAAARVKVVAAEEVAAAPVVLAVVATAAVADLMAAADDATEGATSGRSDWPFLDQKSRTVSFLTGDAAEDSKQLVGFCRYVSRGRVSERGDWLIRRAEQLESFFFCRRFLRG